MIKQSTYNILEKSSREEFQSRFDEIFMDKSKEYLTFIELDYIIEMYLSNEINELRITLELMTEKAKIKVLECVEENCHDEIYESRYKTLKELSDLITYYIEKDEVRN